MTLVSLPSVTVASTPQCAEQMRQMPGVVVVDISSRERRVVSFPFIDCEHEIIPRTEIVDVFDSSIRCAERVHSKTSNRVPRYARSVLIAIEGVDGAGKRTLTEGLRSAFEADGKSVASLAFPRYHRVGDADLAAEALHGGHGDLADVRLRHGGAVRPRPLERRGRDRGLSARHDIVILDRYVASNAAYSAARLHQGVDGDVVAWVRELEFDRFAIPEPDWQVLLAVPTELAAERAATACRAGRRPRQGRLRTRRRSAASHQRGLLRVGRLELVRTMAGRWSGG